MITHRSLLGGLVGLLVLSGCPSPAPSTTSQGPSASGRVVLHFASPSRTVTRDWNTLIASYAVTLTSRDGFAPVTTTVSGATSATVSGVATGTWDIAVDAKDGAGAIVAHAAVGSQALPSATAVNLTLKPLTVGTGSYALTLRFPDLTAPITSVLAQLKKPDGTVAATPVVGAATQPVAGTEEVVISGAGVPSGAYRLLIVLMRGGQAARYINEAINIFDNVASNQWLAPDGTFAPRRDLATADFKSNNDQLDDLSFTLDGQPVSFSFVPTSNTFAWTAESVATTQTYTLTPSQAVPGQTISYSTDGTTFTALASGTASTGQTLVVGANSLWVRVLAADGTQRDYEGTITKIVSPYKLLVWNQGLWEPLGTNAPVGTVAIAGSKDHLVALTAAGQVWEDVDGLWSRNQPDAPTGMQWITYGPSQTLFGASPSALYSLSGGVWRLVAAGPGVPLKGLAALQDTVLGLGTDGVFYRYDQKLWNPSPVSVPAGLVLVAGSGDTMLASTASTLQFFEPPLWLAVGDAPAHVQSLTRAFGSVVALIVQ